MYKFRSFFKSNRLDIIDQRNILMIGFCRDILLTPLYKGRQMTCHIDKRIGKTNLYKHEIQNLQIVSQSVYRKVEYQLKYDIASDKTWA